jgi:hypothetical protein
MLTYCEHRQGLHLMHTPGPLDVSHIHQQSHQLDNILWCFSCRPQLHFFWVLTLLITLQLSRWLSSNLLLRQPMLPRPDMETVHSLHWIKIPYLHRMYLHVIDLYSERFFLWFADLFRCHIRCFPWGLRFEGLKQHKAHSTWTRRWDGGWGPGMAVPCDSNITWLYNVGKRFWLLICICLYCVSIMGLEETLDTFILPNSGPDYRIWHVVCLPMPHPDERQCSRSC